MAINDKTLRLQFSYRPKITLYTNFIKRTFGSYNKQTLLKCNLLHQCYCTWQCWHNAAANNLTCCSTYSRPTAISVNMTGQTAQVAHHHVNSSKLLQLTRQMQNTSILREAVQNICLHSTLCNTYENND